MGCGIGGGDLDMAERYYADDIAGYGEGIHPMMYESIIRGLMIRFAFQGKTDGCGGAGANWVRRVCLNCRSKIYEGKGHIWEMSVSVTNALPLLFLLDPSPVEVFWSLASLVPVIS